MLQRGLATCSTLRALATTPHTFRHALDEELTHAARRRAVAQLKALFSGGGRFYDRKNAKTPLTPGEQKAVGRSLAACGAAEPVEFDAYTELFDFSLRLSYE